MKVLKKFEVFDIDVWKGLKENLYPGDEWITEKKKRNGITSVIVPKNSRAFEPMMDILNIE